MLSRSLLPVAAVVCLLTRPVPGAASELTVWTTRAIATVLSEVGAEFERSSGTRLMISSGLPDAFARRARAGEPFDLLITGSAVVDDWITDGRIVEASRIDIARSGIGVEVRAGARRPDISSVDAFKRALLEAKSIAYLRVGSGLYLSDLLDRLGLTSALASKTTRPDSDIVSELVAKGEVELGMVVVTQILTTPGVELAGPLPPEIQSYVVFTAGVSRNAKAPGPAMELVRYLGGSAARSIIHAQGMEAMP